MNLIRTSLLNSIAVAIRVGTLLVLNKIFALYVGPAGFALVGQFQNLISVLTTIVSGAINGGVVKYTAEYHGDSNKLISLWKTAGSLSLLATMLVCIPLVLMHRELAKFVLHDESYGSVFIVLAISLIFFVMNSLLGAVLNGKKEIFRLVLVNVSGSIIALLVSAALAYFYGVYGALIALSLSQAVLVMATYAICRKMSWFSIINFVGKIDKVHFRNLLAFALMALVSGLVAPFVQMFIRDYLVNNYGMESAGLWQSVYKISDMYLMLVTMTLSTYLFPRLSEIKSNGELWEEIFTSLKIIVPAVCVGALIIYFLRDRIISLLFTADFMAMRDLFLWQLVGDVVKIASWIIGITMLARSMTREYIYTDVIFGIGFYGWSTLLTGYYGVMGVTVAFALNYAIYLVTIYILLRHRLPLTTS